MVPFNLGMDPDLWIESRIQLFIDFCYPSVKNQSNKNFKWIIFFDSRTPKKYLDMISEIDESRMIDFHFTDHWDKLNSEILQILEKEKEDSNHLISTRLDCDDAVFENFIGMIQSEVLKNVTKTPFAINFSNGVILDTQSNIYYRKKMFSNPFISLAQDKCSLNISIFKLEHQTISDSIKTFNLTYPKMWLQVVHGANLINKSSGLPLFKNLGQHFNISYKETSVSEKLGTMLKAYVTYIRRRVNNLKVKINHSFAK